MQLWQYCLLVTTKLLFMFRTSLLDIYHPDPWHAPVAAPTVVSTPDDGRRKRPKYVVILQ
jgi:hypothetical protein